MRDCRKTRERLSAFIDNELPPLERRLIEKHLCQCHSCAEEERYLRHVVVLMDGLLDESPSRSFIPATIHRASSWHRCAYVKEHILMPVLAVLRSALLFVVGAPETDVGRRRSPFDAYLRSFDDFPPESLSSIYIAFVKGTAE
jgi:anti-sigma factor RsiW